MQLAKTLSSYIARQFFAWFCGVFMAMTIVTFLLDYIELIRRSATRIQVTLWVLLEMAALKLPHTAQEVLPFAILFGTMLAFWRLTRNHELVVAREPLQRRSRVRLFTKRECYERQGRRPAIGPTHGELELLGRKLLPRLREQQVALLQRHRELPNAEHEQLVLRA